MEIVFEDANVRIAKSDSGQTLYILMKKSENTMRLIGAADPAVLTVAFDESRSAMITGGRFETERNLKGSFYVSITK